MSQWAFGYTTVSRPLKRIPRLFFFHMAPGRLGLLFIIALSLTLMIADDNVIADRLFQSPESPPAQRQPAAEQPAAQPAPAESQSTEPATDIVSPVSPVSPIQQASSEPLPPIQPLPAPSSSERTDRFLDEEEEKPGDSNFILDRIEMVDTIVVSTAYVWLCCGIVLFLLIPLFFLFLQIRGRSKILREENY
jgi:hypothetical protein